MSVPLTFITHLNVISLCHPIFHQETSAYKIHTTHSLIYLLGLGFENTPILISYTCCFGGAAGPYAAQF